jgi:TPP-dependent pyruvate/acetoin dehydrogenase alpha subunit
MTVVIDKPHLTREHALELLKQMIRIRDFEDKCAELYTQEKIRGFLHLYDGEEAVAVGVIPVLEKRDRIVATYREHGQALVRGVPMTVALAEMYGKQEGCSRGRGGSMHFFDRASNFYGGNAIVGGGLPLSGHIILADRTPRVPQPPCASRLGRCTQREIQGIGATPTPRPESGQGSTTISS